jgi:drug/metabolite transporter (DMT)-like permease
MPYLGEIAALITATLWAGSSIVFTEAAKRIGNLQININRLIVASVLLFFTLLIAGWFGPVSNQQIWLLTASGLIGLIFGDGFLFKALQIMGARNSMMIMSLVPALSALLAFFFLGEKLSITVIIGMTVTLMGILVVVLEEKTHARNEKVTAAGAIYAFLGALGQAIGLLFAKAAFASGEINSFYAAFIRIFTSTMVFLPGLLIVKRYRNPFVLYKKDVKSLWLTIAGGVLGPFFGITFSLIAVKNTDVGVASTLMATVPILMLPLVHFVYKEKISTRAILGSVLSVAGIAILFLRAS